MWFVMGKHGLLDGLEYCAPKIIARNSIFGKIMAFYRVYNEFVFIVVYYKAQSILYFN